jgi:menaquinol-cytochrome c reductase iron-sulfur subunit
MDDDKKLSRRGFLGLATFSIGGLISLILGIPAIAYIVSPATKREEEDLFIPLGASDKVIPGEPTLFRTKITQKAGWITEDRELSYFVLTEDRREYSALSNICTHLSCRVRWVADEEKFYCPCHNGVFDKDGNVVSGPPPRPLDSYQVKEENGQLFVEYG